MRTVFLGTGSAGNATAVAYSETLILIDCGFSAREVARRLTAVGLDPADVSAIFVTHEHGDHVRGIDVFCRRHAPACMVHATSGTLRASGLVYAKTDTNALRPGDPLRVGDLEVTAFATSHDAIEPVGYRITGGACTYGHMTDSGVLTDAAIEALSDVDVLGIESNHDLRMLENGPYPHHLKRRIASDDGHLSNAAAADAVESLLSDRLRLVVGLHRSSTNNTASLARQVLATRMARIGVDVPVRIAGQDEPCDPETGG